MSRVKSIYGKQIRGVWKNYNTGISLRILKKE